MPTTAPCLIHSHDSAVDPGIRRLGVPPCSTTIWSSCQVAADAAVDAA
jgi:hypothetical protein